MGDILIGAAFVSAALLLLFWAGLVAIAVRICLGLARWASLPPPSGTPSDP